MMEAMLNVFSLQGYNLIVEGTPRTGSTLLATADLLRGRGYAVSLAVMAVKPRYRWSAARSATSSCVWRAPRRGLSIPGTIRPSWRASWTAWASSSSPTCSTAWRSTIARVSACWPLGAPAPASPAQPCATSYSATGQPKSTSTTQASFPNSLTFAPCDTYRTCAMRASHRTHARPNSRVRMPSRRDGLRCGHPQVAPRMRVRSRAQPTQGISAASHRRMSTSTACVLQAECILCDNADIGEARVTKRVGGRRLELRGGSGYYRLNYLLPASSFRFVSVLHSFQKRHAPRTKVAIVASAAMMDKALSNIAITPFRRRRPRQDHRRCRRAIVSCAPSRADGDWG